MKVLIVEDNKELCALLKYPLEVQGIDTDFCYDGYDALLYLDQNDYDVIVLDRMLPGMNGMTILTRLRSNHITTPVIMATALGSLNNRIEGLETGADDYITKPFDIPELIARIRAQARRNGSLSSNSLISYGDLTLDCDQMTLINGEYHCELSKREYDLIHFFLCNSNQILTRETLLDRVWGLDSLVTDGNIDNFIFFLRKRLKTIHSTVSLRTIRSVGYRLENPND